MSSKTFAIALCVALTALTPATPAAGGALDGITVPRTGPQAHPKPSWTFPAPLAGNPPAETWLPPLLSDEDKKHRAAADQALMVGEYANSSELDNAGTLQAELRGQDYDELETQLDAVLAKFQADPSYELLLESMANFAEEAHVRGSPADVAQIQAWVKARPNNPWAHYSAGVRWSATAWEDRGGGFAGSVTDVQWKMLHEDEIQARAELQAAIKLNPKQPLAWAALVDVDRSDTGTKLDQSTADFNQGSKQVPTSYLIADQYETTLQPRWLGSAAMMDDFAQSELTNVDRNPRFWDLQGESLADSGCQACNDIEWGVSLKQYNAALAFADRPSWLARAGQAALHVHRYALADALFERALAYRNDLQWLTFRDFSVELCDPSKTPEEVERFRKDVVRYGGLEDDQYPRDPDSCVVYQRELPWGAEPLPDATSLVAYTIDSIAHPTFVKEPQAVFMQIPGKAPPAASPDGAWVVTLSDSADETHHLMLSRKGGDKPAEIYAPTGNVMVGFTSDSKHLFVSDWTKGQEGGCRYIDPNEPSRGADLKPLVTKWIPALHIDVDMNTVVVLCTQFVNDRILSSALSGEFNGGRVFRQFNYDTVAGKLVPAQNF